MNNFAVNHVRGLNVRGQDGANWIERRLATGLLWKHWESPRGFKSARGAAYTNGRSRSIPDRPKRTARR
jgi:hypothetical protein